MRLKEIMEFQRTLEHDPWLDEPMNEEERQACEDADDGLKRAAAEMRYREGYQARQHKVRLKAQRALERLTIADSVEMREQIIETAEAAGTPSIWLDVFEADEDMCRRLRVLEG